MVNTTRRPAMTARRIAQEVVKLILLTYAKLFHRFQQTLGPAMPRNGPCLVVTSHFSFLDVVALMVADPFIPHTAMVVKNQVMQVPVVSHALRIWGCIPV